MSRIDFCLWRTVPEIRLEQPNDAAAIRRVLQAAFPTADEAHLVDDLRATGQLVISLVAEDDGELVGHIALSPVSLAGSTGGIGLAPLAVLPDRQRRGIGGQLIRAGLAECARAGFGWVVVLGDAAYYRRFGFVRASSLGLDNEYGADENFMVQELRPEALPATAGLVRYGPAFARFGSG